MSDGQYKRFVFTPKQNYTIKPEMAVKVESIPESLGSYELDERCAILEFEAGYTRQIAENMATAQYARQIQKDLAGQS